jgi:hypothetical protein
VGTAENEMIRENIELSEVIGTSSRMGIMVTDVSNDKMIVVNTKTCVPNGNGID